MKVDTVVATLFVCWTVVFVPITATYHTLYFSADSDDVYTYKQFVTQLREALESGNVSHGIPVLRSQVPVDSDDRFVLIDIDSGGRIPKIAVDVINANVVGFSVNDNNSYFFRDVSDEIYNSPLFEEATKTKLPYGGSYTGLQVAGAYRNKVTLGDKPLNAAVVQLYNYPSIGTNIASSLLVIIQMISEAARSASVENILAANYTTGLVPKGGIISLEDTWRILSVAIQTSEAGKFPTIYMQDDDYNILKMSSLVQVQAAMGLLLAKDSTETDTRNLINNLSSAV